MKIFFSSRYFGYSLNIMWLHASLHNSRTVANGLFDLCAAKLIYEKATAKALGQEISP